MRKTTIIGVYLLASYNFTQANVFRIGPRIGLSASRIVIEEHTNRFTDSAFVRGYQGGVVARLHLPICYVQPELLITSAGGKARQQAQETALRYTTLALPVLVGTSLGGLRIQAGPAFNWLLLAEEKDKDIKGNYSLLSVGYQGGLGIDIGRIMVDVKYEGSLTKFGHQLAGFQTDHRLRLFILAIGFNLL